MGDLKYKQVKNEWVFFSYYDQSIEYLVHNKSIHL